jgi:predicted dehydrogenase
VACIGAGGIAGAHMTEYAKMKDVEIVALADPLEAPMLKHAEQFKVPRENCFTDYHEMLRKIGPDAVSVCSPNGAHYPNTIAALEAGAHVMVEKPMAMNAQECQKMIAAAAKHKRKLVIGFQHRYDGKTQFLRRAVEEGLLGNVLYGQVQALRRRGIPNWGVFGRKELQGGGPMIDIGVHCLEMTHYTMGSPKPVSAIGNTFTYLGNKPSDQIACEWKNWDYKTYTVEDLAVGQIRFDTGAVLTIEASFAAHIPKDVWSFRLMGDKGGCASDPPALFRDDAGHMVNTNPHWTPNINIFFAKMRNFVDHVLYNKSTMAPAEHGLMVQKMLDGIYQSAAKGGHEVKIN